MNYTLYDDDAQDLFDEAYYCSLGTYEAAFREAYIEPDYLSTASYSDQVNFNLNLTYLEIITGVDYDNKQDVWSSEDFWACLVVSCYQPKTSEDIDPDGTGPGDPEIDKQVTPGAVPEDTDNAAAIFIETRNDMFNWSENLVVTHEVGHTGGPPDHESGSCIMNPDAYDPSSFCDNCLNTFRENKTWLTTND